MLKKLDLAAIIFDFDGVLVDTGKDIANAANFALRKLGLETLPNDIVISFIGGGAERLIKKCLELRNASGLFEPAIQLFRDYYSRYPTDKTQLYPGVEELLVGCISRGIRMGIATNKDGSVTQKILENFGIAPFFEIVVDPSMVRQRKPDPEAIEMILRHFSLSPNKALMVGDKQEDILAGKSAGTYTCGVTYGFGTLEEVLSAEPDFIISRAIDLLDLLN